MLDDEGKVWKRNMSIKGLKNIAEEREDIPQDTPPYHPPPGQLCHPRTPAQRSQ